MDITENNLNEIMVCSGCNNVYKYYDYLYHLESNVCNIFNHTTNNIYDYEYAEYADDEEDDKDDEEDNGYDNGDYNITRNESQIHVDLYNPFINHGLYNNLINNNLVNRNDFLESNNNNNNNNFITLFENFTIKYGLDNINNYGILYNINTPKQCPICIELYPINCEFYNMICMHEFCFKCAEKWFSQSEKCPLCNQNLKLFVSG